MSRKKRAGLCITKFCRNDHAQKDVKCSKCKMRRWRASKKMHACWSRLRDRSAAKGIPFDLTVEWLQNFLDENGYDHKLHHIDRVCVLGGYTKNNLQILPYSENIAKGNRERYGQSYML
jgi:hypothetical protein